MRRRFHRPLAGALAAASTLAVLAVAPAANAASFGLVPGSVTARTCAAAEVTCTASTPLETQAGAHPTGTVSFALSSETVSPEPTGHIGTIPVGRVKDAVVQLPPGFVGDPQAVPQCSYETLKSISTGGCPRDTMVGYVTVVTAFSVLHTPPQPAGTLVTPVFNLVPAPGQTARFGFIINQAAAQIVGSVRTDGDYGVTVASNDIVGDDIKEVTTTFWGAPAEHNGPGPISVTGYGTTSSVGGPGFGSKVPFLTNPSSCSSGELTTRVIVDSWEDPGALLADGEPNLTDPAWQSATASSPQPTGCSALPFSPSLRMQPVTHEIDTPSGYEVTLSSPQNQTVGGVGEADLRGVQVTLPPGVTVDPSAADGLEGCSDAQYGYGTNNPVSCPAGSQIGEVEIETPLLAPHSLTGEVYLGTPLNDEPESGGMFRLFLALHGPGLLIKIEGDATASSADGQLSATFADNPPLPFSELKLRFNGGSRASLANPSWCESAQSSSLLSSFAGQTLPFADPVSFEYDGAGAPCPASEPFAPSFSAGAAAPVAAAYSPFTLTLSRQDREQALSGVSVQMPKGLLGMISHVARCGEPQAGTGDCPATSQIGTAMVSAGVGPTPFWLSGPVYLTGGYGGAPFGLSVAVPVIAGPFNLGTTVVRAGIYVNPVTAAVSVLSGPFPQILDGVPTRIRTVNVNIDRPQFMRNPTGCEAQQVSGTLASAQGAQAAVSSPFGIGGCRGLAFKPTFSALVHAGHTRKRGEYLHVVVKSALGQANIAKVHVTLPEKLPSRESTLKQACLAAQFEKDPAGCPAESFVGYATARSPVLSSQLKGPAIFVSHGGAAFPDLDVVLQGEGVTIQLTGNTNIHKGVTTSTFASVPDVPVERFDLVLPEGPHSALAGEGNLCKHPLYMPTEITGQNGAAIRQRTKIMVRGCRGKASAARRRYRHKHRHHLNTHHKGRKASMSRRHGGEGR